MSRSTPGASPRLYGSDHWRAGCQEIWHVPFGKGPSEKDPHHGHLVGGLLHPVGDGEFLYLATVIDCFSRRLVGWSIAGHMRTSLVADALKAAETTRGSLAGAVFHSDHGAQGGFNRSSQHPDLGGVRRGHGGLEFEDQRCSRGGASAVAC